MTDSPDKDKIDLVIHKLKKTLVVLVAISILSVLSLRWIHPITSSFMMQRQLRAFFNGEQTFNLRYDWVDYEKISPYIKLAAITSEDQNFPNHVGFALEQIKKVIENYTNGGDLRGASTITQQTAKNLYLYPAQNFFRKGLEAYFTILLELLLSKERILEIYLNIAAFGNGVYGVKAATARYFNTRPIHLTKYQSALMVTALPNPDDYNLEAPSGYMRRRAQWVMRYMNLLGGKSYLKQL